MDYITVIGSTDISPLEKQRLFKFTKYLVEQGFSLRSGKAPGADQAAQEAAEEFGRESDAIRDHQIFLPWPHFEKNAQNVTSAFDIWDFTPEEIAGAEAIVSTVHPVWENLKQGQRKFHIRNTFQPLGLDLKSPSKGLIACSDTDSHGEPTGGTRTAWVIAQRYNIPCINIRDISDSLVKKWIDKYLLK